MAGLREGTAATTSLRVAANLRPSPSSSPEGAAHGGKPRGPRGTRLNKVNDVPEYPHGCC